MERDFYWDLLWTWPTAWMMDPGIASACSSSESMQYWDWRRHPLQHGCNHSSWVKTIKHRTGMLSWQPKKLTASCRKTGWSQIHNIDDLYMFISLINEMLVITRLQKVDRMSNVSAVLSAIEHGVGVQGETMSTQHHDLFGYCQAMILHHSESYQLTWQIMVIQGDHG